MRLIFAFFFSLFFISQSSAQEFELVVDTVYKKFMFGEGTCIFTNRNKAIKFKNGEIDSYPVFKSKFTNFERNELAIWIGDYLYPIDREFNFMENDSARIGGYLSHGAQHLMIYGDYVSYVRNDSVFVNNFKSKHEQFAIHNGTCHGLNNKYVWIQREYPEEDYIYKFENDELLKLPESYSYPRVENSWLIVNFDFMLDGPDVIEVLDDNLNEVISSDQQYNDIALLNDLAIFTSPRKRGAVYYKGKKLDFKYNIKEANCYQDIDWCIFRTDKDMYGVVDNDSEIVFEPIFEDINKALAYDEVSLTSEDISFLYKNGKEIFRTKGMQKIERLSEGYYLKRNGFAKTIVDQKDSLVLDVRYTDFVSMVDIFDHPIIYGKLNDIYRIWDMKGRMISEWTNVKGDSYIYPYYGYRDINLKMYQNMDVVDFRKINNSDLLIYIEKDGSKKKYYLINVNGEKISKAYTRIIKIDKMNHFVVRTFSGKYGVIKVKN